MRRLCARHFIPAALLVLSASSACPSEGGPLFQENGKKKGEDAKKAAPKEPQQSAGLALEAWGALKEVKGTPFFTFDYTRAEGKKASKKSAFVKVAGDTEFYTDKSISSTDLKEGDSVWVLGRPSENNTPGKNGYGGGMDRQLQNVSAIVAGESLRVNRAYKDPKDPKVVWCEATVAKTGPAILVKYEGSNYKVTMGKAAPVMLREKAGTAKGVKSGVQVEVSAEKSDEKPDTKSAGDAKKGSFVAKKIVFLDKRLMGTLYPMLLE